MAVTQLEPKGAGGALGSYKPQSAMITGLRGLSLLSFGVLSISLKTVSKPSITLPKTTCLPSK